MSNYTLSLAVALLVIFLHNRIIHERNSTILKIHPFYAMAGYFFLWFYTMGTLVYIFCNFNTDCFTNYIKKSTVYKTVMKVFGF